MADYILDPNTHYGSRVVIEYRNGTVGFKPHGHIAATGCHLYVTPDVRLLGDLQFFELSGEVKEKRLRHQPLNVPQSGGQGMTFEMHG